MSIGTRIVDLTGLGLIVASGYLMAREQFIAALFCAAAGGVTIGIYERLRYGRAP